ncbi:MAG: DUF4157 domain-containing protein, partial [Anaerolineaceae bacterium]|nr:DUF4157 domain-containing protein [Anaerolineaceae bacterium]
MGNTYTRQNTTEDKHKQREEILNSSGEKQTLPNSVVSRIMELPGAETGAGSLSELPNSVVSRIMERPKAEAEADDLSAGVTSGTPSSVRREMGGRLGADFSGVRFHSGPSSARQSEAMGAQAWTQGRDVYFGKSGFTPSLAAHELVHTVQQGAVRGNVSQSMPAGAIQLKTDKQKVREEQNPGLKKAEAKDFQITEDDGPLPGDAGEISALETKLANTFATSRGLNIYNAIRFDLDDMICSRLTRQLTKKNDGKKFQVKFRPKSASFFLVRAAYQDYALRDIMTDLVWKGAGLFKTNVRIRQYKALIKSISDRLGPYQIRELASQAGMIVEEPRVDRKDKARQVNKRSYELDVEDPEADKFNPANIPEVATIQEEIDNAGTFEEAYKIFANFAGNEDATIEYEVPKRDKGEVKPDLVLFKNKLKHMSRQVWDYPELRNTIGNLLVADSTVDSHMGVMRTNGGRQKTDIYYNAYHDRSGAEGEEARRKEWAKIQAADEWNGDFDHNGNHELGHLLAHNMPMRNETAEEGEDSSSRHETENDIIKEVLLNRDILTPEQKGQIKYYRSEGYGEGKYSKLKHYKG